MSGISLNLTVVSSTTSSITLRYSGVDITGTNLAIIYSGISNDILKTFNIVISDTSGNVTISNDYNFTFVLGTTYTFKLREFVGGAIYHSGTLTHLMAGLPAAPLIDESLTSTFDRSVQLYITLNATNGTPITDLYVYYQVIDPSNQNAGLIDASFSVSDDNLYVITDLSNGYVYEFSVVAVNSTGPSNNSNTLELTPSNKPQKVEDLVLVPTSQSINVSWEAPLDPYTTTVVTSYTLQRSIFGSEVITESVVFDISGSIFYNGDVSLNFTSATGKFSYNFNNLVNYTTYKITVFASSILGEGLKNSDDSTPFNDKLQVHNLLAHPSNHRIDLSWNAPLDNHYAVVPVNSYTVKLYSITGTSLVETLVSTKYGDASGNGPVFNTYFNDLSNGVLYIAKVQTTVLNTDLSANVTSGATSFGVKSIPFTTADVVEDLASNLYPGLAILDWNPPTNTGGYLVKGYIVNVYKGTSLIMDSSFNPTDSSIVLNLENDISYNVYVATITGYIQNFDETNPGLPTTVTGTFDSIFVITTTEPEQIVVNTVNNVSLELTSTTTATLSWRRPTPIITGGAANSSVSNIQYNIYSTNIDGFIISLVATVNDISSNTDFSYNVTGLAAGTSYFGIIITLDYTYPEPTQANPSATTTVEVNSQIQNIDVVNGDKPGISYIIDGSYNVVVTVTFNSLDIISALVFAPNMSTTTTTSFNPIITKGPQSSTGLTTIDLTFTYGYSLLLKTEQPILIAVTNSVGISFVVAHLD